MQEASPAASPPFTPPPEWTTGIPRPVLHPPGLERLRLYFHYCDLYRSKPDSSCVVAFLYPTSVLAVTPAFTTADVPALAQMLLVDRLLKVVDLHHATALGNAGAYALVDAVATNTQVRELNLSYQSVGEHGCVALARGLARSRSLVRVLLRGNRIGAAGAAALAAVLRDPSSPIHYLDVSNNYLRVRGIHEITQALTDRARAGMALAAAGGAAPPTTSTPHPSPNGDGGGTWGWLWGDVQRLVVTNDFVVRTNWAALTSSKQGPVGQGVARSGSGVGGGPVAADGGVEGEAGGHGDVGGGVRRRWRGPGVVGAGGAGGGVDPRGRGAGHHGATAEAPGGGEVGAVDVEVRVSGNFVQEEVFNSVVHGTGLVLSLLGAFPLLNKGRAWQDTAPTIGLMTYIGALIAFFASSTLNHSLHLTNASAVFRLIDHSAVYILIAATYTPFLVTNMAHCQPLSTSLLLGVWALSLVGVAFSTLCCRSVVEDSFPKRLLRMALYCAIGWVGVIPFMLLRPCIQPQGWALLVGGGLVFSCGVVLHLQRNRDNPHVPHGWWYVFVLLACVAHWCAVYWYVEAPPTACLALSSTLPSDHAAMEPGGMPSHAPHAGDRVAVPQAAHGGSHAEWAVLSSGGGQVLPSHAEMAGMLAAQHNPSLTGPVTSMSAMAEIMATTAATLAEAAAAAASDSKRAFKQNALALLQQAMHSLEAV